MLHVPLSGDVYAAGFSQGGGVGLTLAEWMIDGEPSRDVFAMDVARFGDYTNKAYTRLKVRENYECPAAVTLLLAESGVLAERLAAQRNRLPGADLAGPAQRLLVEHIANLDGQPHDAWGDAFELEFAVGVGLVFLELLSLSEAVCF